MSSSDVVPLLRHAWHQPSDYCTRCGIGKHRVSEKPSIGCVPGGSNVVGISHIIAQRRMERLARAVISEMFCQ